MSLTQLPDRISRDEVVGHFILSKSEFSIQKAQVKHRALEPSLRENSISVVRIRDLSEENIWEWGRQNVISSEAQTLYARADMHVLDIILLKLSIEPDEPPVRHANIANWPSQKDAMIAVAQQLAARAILRLPNP